MKSFVYLSVFALIFTLSAFSIQDAFAVSVQTDVPVSVSCTSSGQLCSPLFSSTVETQSELKVKFTAHPGHCSSIDVNIFLDGNPMGTTGFLGWPAAPFPFDALPLMSGIIDLGPVSPGTHQISLQGKGQVGGCNSGYLAGWGGTLTTFTESLEQVVSGNILPLNTTSLLLAGVQTNLLWMVPTLAGLVISVVYLRAKMHND
jgi:hypothetical protein